MRERQQELLKGFDVEWIDELPQGITGCIFSNEFFDALPVHRVVRRGGVLREIYVTEDFKESRRRPSGTHGRLRWRKVRSPTSISKRGRGFGASPHSLDRGYHLAIDYGYLRDEFYAQPHGTLMCYWRHQATENPYTRIGEQDITAHVNFSDLMDEGAAASLQTVRFQTQMDFLIELGILDEIQKFANAGDAASLQRLLRIKKLILPGSMGERFKVLVQTKQ